ncbi:hypothetical protein [Klebsiella aerogenes]|uniref:hypothetical protein n=1 Tax=Klebsiella aerogenes TaxID=548 RepID=UPI003D30F727
MKIQYQDYGAVANVVITSSVFEVRRHNRVIDVVLFLIPGMVSNSSGFFIMKTVLSGQTKQALRAYKHLIRETKR